MYLKKEKGRIWKLVGFFFVGMILFTLLSRAVYQHGTAVVTTEAPSSGVIRTGTGTYNLHRMAKCVSTKHSCRLRTGIRWRSGLRSAEH